MWRGATIFVVIHPILVKLNFDVTNNVAEYKACIIKLQAIVEIGVKNIRVYGDLNLTINQISQIWKVRSDSLVPHQVIQLNSPRTLPTLRTPTCPVRRINLLMPWQSYP